MDIYKYQPVGYLRPITRIEIIVKDEVENKNQVYNDWIEHSLYINVSPGSGVELVLKWILKSDDKENLRPEIVEDYLKQFGYEVERIWDDYLHGTLTERWLLIKGDTAYKAIYTRVKF